ncbi:MAG: ABC transporter ATP-binding protein [Desulfitobacteriaceae bacterium]
MLFKFRNITYSIGSVQPLTLSAEVKEGGVLVVRGPSGAGKSTLLRILARLQSSQGGEAFLQNENWLTISGPLWRAAVHYLAQKPAIFDGSVAANLARPFALRLSAKKKFDVDQAKQLLADLLLPSALWDQDARTLSGGEVARLAFVRALLLDPQVLLLDEPTAALDEASRDAFYQVLQGWLNVPGRAALLISHIDDYEHLKNLDYLHLPLR